MAALILAPAADLPVRVAAVCFASPSSEVRIFHRTKEPMNAETVALMLSGRAGEEPAVSYSGP